MSESRHTPGPWTFTANEAGDTFWIGNDDENAACVPGYTDHPLNIANARLIAAAPDLLESLEGLMPVLRAVTYTTGLGKNQINRVEKASAAIAKATQTSGGEGCMAMDTNQG